MLQMVEVTYTQDQRDAALTYFQEHGLTHYAGNLVVKGLWVATGERIAYVLVESSDAAEVDSACDSLRQFGDVQHHAVIASDQLQKMSGELLSDSMDNDIANLPNLGPRSAEMLAAAGIYTREQLEDLGPVAAYLAAKQADAGASLNLLWGIVAALDGVHWTQITAERKAELRADLDALTR